jgi:hypothetical protein
MLRADRDGNADGDLTRFKVVPVTWDENRHRRSPGAIRSDASGMSFIETLPAARWLKGTDVDEYRDHP